MQTPANQSGQWEEAFRSQEQDHANELEKLREDHEVELIAVKDAYAQVIDAASSLNSLAESRVKDLTSEKLDLKKDLQAKETILQSAVAASQELQQNLDELKNIHDASLEDHSCVVDILQQENSQLLGVISSMQSKEQEQFCHRTSNEHIEASLSVFEEQQEMQEKLQKAKKDNSTLAAGLAAAQHQALFFQKRAYDLSHVLESSPNEFASIRGVIEQKDQMFSDLEKRAGACFEALTELKKSSDEEKELAEKEIALLTDKLAKSQRSNAALQESKNIFQEQCENVYTMLQKRIFATDFTEAMSHYFQIATQDNAILKNEVQRQASEISRDGFKILSLETEIRLVKKTLQEKERSGSELEIAARSKEAEIGRLELRLDDITRAFKESSDQKDAQITDLGEKLQDRFNVTPEQSLDDRERGFLQTREDEITKLVEMCQRLTDANQQLEWHLESQAQNCADNAAYACLIEQTAKEYKRKWEKAENKTRTEQKRIREELGIPDSGKVPSALDQMLELKGKRLKIEVLEEEIEALEEELTAAQDEAARYLSAHERARDCGEQRATQMEKIGRELLARLRNAQGPLRFIESDIPTDELAQMLDECRKAFQPNEAKGKGKEREH